VYTYISLYIYTPINPYTHTPISTPTPRLDLVA
jgi:hypothetical protein